MKSFIEHYNTKASMLLAMKQRVNLSRVPDFLYFTRDEYLQNKDLILQKITNKFGAKDCTLAIRSSALDEDGKDSTCAGEYHTELDVDSNNVQIITKSIDTVLSSYERKGPAEGRNEFIVQEMLQNMIMSGVVFTHDLNTGAPYYVINYDDVSGLTNTVTSGDGEYSNRTLYIHRGATEALRSQRFQNLMKAIMEVEEITDNQYLDIEFALDENLTPYILQVRSISTSKLWDKTVYKNIDQTLKSIQSFVKRRFREIPGIYGKTTVLGQMPDWNPAEMIGRVPRALAFSLYKKLITDNAWSEARKEMGYLIPVGQPLMVSLAGQPFIDTRLSFHSFLPSKLPISIGEKLVDAWVAKIRENPELHDKVEFDIAITAYGFDIDDKIESLTRGVLDDSEKAQFRELVKLQTYNLLLDSDRGGVSSALRKIDELSEKQSIYEKMTTHDDATILFSMIDDCVQLGTIPFSILARHGFIAKILLLSLESKGIITEDEIGLIQSSTQTVASEIVNDMRRMGDNVLSKASFMTKYGHLRPGTYDILSLRYDQLEDIGVSDKSNGVIEDKSDYKFNSQQTNSINILLKEEGLNGLDADKLLTYIQQATAGREYSKFVFTKTISNMLEIIAQYGEKFNLNREDMSHIPLDVLLNAATSSEFESHEMRLRAISLHEKNKHAISVAVRLPQVLFDEAGVHIVPFQVSHPNFITNKKVTAASIVIDQNVNSSSLDGKIVLIENADPGFDWIFGHQIAGLITKYGGVNSHMAIRCAEFGIPAAIGCGEQRFERLVNVDMILLDSSSSIIQHLH